MPASLDLRRLAATPLQALVAAEPCPQPIPAASTPEALAVGAACALAAAGMVRSGLWIPGTLLGCMTVNIAAYLLANRRRGRPA